VRSGRARAWLGVALHPDRLAIRNVVPDSPAWRAGLTFNDEIVAVAGARVTPATFARRIGDHRPGARIAVAYFRRDQLEQTTVTLAANPERKLTISANPHADASARAARAGWFGISGH
jgi:predicted metalloprotease with PDZ domain